CRTMSLVTQLLSGDLEAERRVLGILIKHPHLVDTAVDRMRPEFFVDPVHRLIFQIILDLYNSEGRISYTQVYNRLRREGSVPAPEDALLSLTEAFATAAELDPSIDTLAQGFARRRIYEAAEEIQKLVMSADDMPVSALQA